MMGEFLADLSVKKQKLLVLDLDETLIYTAYSPIEGAALKAKRGYFYLYERPYLKPFLDRCSAEYDLAIWSASKPDYVSWIIRSTALSQYEFVFINTRKNCNTQLDALSRPKYFKILTEEMLKYKRVRFLDDTPACVVPIEIAEKAPEYKGEAGDCFLGDWGGVGYFFLILYYVNTENYFF